MSTRKRQSVLTALALVASSTALAADLPYPTFGQVHNTVENGWLTYECTPPEHGLLTCSFVQTSIRQALSEIEAAKRLAEETNDLADSLAKDYKTTPTRIYDSPQWKELCNMASQMAAILDGVTPADTPPEALRNLSRLNAVQKKDMHAWAEAIGQSCTTRTLEGVRNSIALSLGSERRTCNIGTNPFTQTFKAQYSGDTFQAWVVADSRPVGDCGVINVSRLVPETTKPGDKPYLWRYYARKVVTNPTADVLLMKCSDLDEREYLYDWRQQSIPLQCDYIKPGM